MLVPRGVLIAGRAVVWCLRSTLWGSAGGGGAMRIALISDIHGMDVAFEAVLADMQRQPVDQIICLGDVAT